MSHSTLQAIWPGEKHENIVEYSNSWGTAPIIWETFCERYLQYDKNWWLLNCNRMPNPLWSAWKRLDIPKSDRAVLLYTLDYSYVQKKDYKRFAKDLRDFLDTTKISGTRSNHWPEIAAYYEKEPEYPALALWCTSVASDPFVGPYNEERDEYEPFDWNLAWDLYEELDENDITLKRT